jgi:hypothetical protein
MIFFNLDCNNKNPQQKQQPTDIERERERERERENSQAIVELSSAIISSQEPSSPLEERGD